MEKYEIRARRVRQLIEEKFGGVDARLAVQIGRSATQVARWFMSDPKHHRNIGERLARHIEASTRLPALWLDEDTDSAAPKTTLGTNDHVRQDFGRLIDEASEWLSPEQLEEIHLGLSTLFAKMLELATSNAKKLGVTEKSIIEQIMLGVSMPPDILKTYKEGLRTGKRQRLVVNDDERDRGGNTGARRVRKKRPKKNVT